MVPGILRLPISGSPTTWRAEAAAAGAWVEPTDVALDAAHDRLIVADAGQGVLQAVDLDGRPLGAWGNDPDDVLRLRRPEHLSLGADGRLAVLDTRSARATIYQAQPETRWRFEVFDVPCLCGSVRDVALLEEASWQAKASSTTPHTLRVTKFLAPEAGALRLRLTAGGEAWLWLDDRLVLQDRLGAGSPRSLLLPLSAEEHRLEIILAGIEPGESVRIEAERIGPEMLRRLFLPWAGAS